MAWQRNRTPRPLKEAIVSVIGQGRGWQAIPAVGVGRQWRRGNGRRG